MRDDRLRHAELVSASQTHPNLVLDLLVTSLAMYEYASAYTLCSLVLHAHRVSHMLPCNSVLNLLAIRTRFAPFVRKSAPLKREGTCAFPLAPLGRRLGEG